MNDRLVLWFGSVVLVGVGVNLLSDVLGSRPAAILPAVIFVTALLMVAPKAGLLRWQRRGRARWAQILGLLSLAIYVAIAIWGAYNAWSLPLLIVGSGFLWGTCVLLGWQTLHRNVDLTGIAAGTAFFLVGVAGVWSGFRALRTDSGLIGWAVLLLGLGISVYGFSGLLREDHRVWLAGMALMPAGIAFVLVGVAFLGDDRSYGIAFFPAGVASLLFGVASSFVASQVNPPLWHWSSAP